MLQTYDGFQGYISLIDEDNSRSKAIILWASKDAADAAEDAPRASMIAAPLSSCVVVAPRIPRTGIPLYLLGAPRYRSAGGGPVVG